MVAPKDDPQKIEGLLSFLVPRFGPRLFESAAMAKDGNAMLRLRRGSVVRAAGPAFRSHGRQFVRNRAGFYVEAEHLELLSSAEKSLGFVIGPSTPPPFGVVTGTKVKVRSSPDIGAAEIESLPRWSWIASRSLPPEPEATAAPGWVSLPGGGYVEQGQLSVFREPAHPSSLGPQERWIAIDLQEQLAVAYEGAIPVRIMPCSTGKAGNTPKGEYRIELKKRVHTMRLLMGQVRVEDVPWVMFFDRKQALAVHTSYWHDDFGVPRSHGCVNLPEHDAKWVYEWTLPLPAVEDSETLAVPGALTSRVVIF
jgi:hypothetical protein